MIDYNLVIINAECRITEPEMLGLEVSSRIPTVPVVSPLRFDSRGLAIGTALKIQLYI